MIGSVDSVRAGRARVLWSGYTGGVAVEGPMLASLNVLGMPLRPCSLDPLTGWFRDGCCNTDVSDRGSHTVCAQVTDPFLAFLAGRGNDLITPAPDFGFPGLTAGDKWCVCARSWREAHLAGVGCPVYLECTHASALAVVPLEELMAHAVGISA